jgi:peptide chain release factor subunit 1
MLSEKLDTYKLKIECSNCDYIESRVVKERNYERIKTNIQNEACPKCSSNSFNIVQSVSLIEELGEIAESTGTNVDILSTETEEGEMLHNTFGGIAAILRYKLDY